MMMMSNTLPRHVYHGVVTTASVLSRGVTGIGDPRHAWQRPFDMLPTRCSGLPTFTYCGLDRRCAGASQGGPVVLTAACLQLIVCMFMCLRQVIPPVKTAAFKLTVSTNREAVNVMELFGDLVVQVRGPLAQPSTL